MSSLFVTHLHHVNALKLDYARSSLYTVCIIMFLLIILSFGIYNVKSTDSSSSVSLFSIPLTLFLKGLAIILIVLGHISQHCTVGSEALSYRVTANAGVIIFLFVSGVGLAKRYHLRADRMFWLNRARKLAIPVWLSLILFITLNFLLLGHTDSPVHLILNFLGIFWTEFPNSPCWFITYILFLYGVYFVAALLPANRTLQLTVLSALPLIASWVVIATGSIDHFVLWPQYSLIFPAGVICGLYAERLENINQKLFTKFPIAFYACLLALLALYWTGIGVYRISHLIPGELFVQTVGALINPAPLIFCLILLVYLLETKGLRSAFLEVVGKYSFEIYLLHFPFMVYYDFFLFRRPLVFFFFLYAAFVLLLSIMFQAAATYLETLVFKNLRVSASH